MKYLLTTTDHYGNEVEVAKFAGLGDAYWTFKLFKEHRETIRTLAIYKVSGKSRERLYHYENESPLVFTTLG
jgi:hypothetical protein